LFNQRHLQVPVGVEAGEGRLLDGNACSGARELGAVVPIVDLYQQVARLDGLVVDDGDRLDETRDLGRQRGDFAPNVRIIQAVDYVGVPAASLLRGR
jgi:hypothetical protein